MTTSEELYQRSSVSKGQLPGHTGAQGVHFLVDPSPFKDRPLACLSHISLLKVFQSLSDSGMLVHTSEALKRLMNKARITMC